MYYCGVVGKILAVNIFLVTKPLQIARFSLEDAQFIDTILLRKRYINTVRPQKDVF